MATVVNRGVHIIGGDSAAGAFKQAFPATDRLLVSADILSCGPTPEFSDIQRWREVRLRYLRDLFTDAWEQDFFASPVDLLNNLNRLRHAGPIYVWAGTGVEDQLLIAFVVRLVEHAGGDPLNVHVVQFETLPGRVHLIRGMGELGPQQMLVHPEPRKATEDALAQYKAAWHALTSPTPSQIESFPDSFALPSRHLANAMECMLRKYPQLSSGLNYWDLLILANVKERGPIAARVIGYTMAHDLSGADWVGDSYLFWRLRRMTEGHCTTPLLVLSGATTTMRGTEVTLTSFGEDVLEGRASSFPTNPIHDWVAGVELSSTSSALWFNDNGRIVSATE